MDKFDSNYYASIYDQDFVHRQQHGLDKYFAGQDEGFAPRINFILQFDRYLAGKDILDLGCGVGTFALLLARRGFNTVGLDFSENSIAQCRANAEKQGLTNARFVLGDCAQDHFGVNQFDSIVAADIVEHLPPAVLQKALTNCRHWLRPGGALLIHTFETRYFYMLRNRLAFLLLPAFGLPRPLTPAFVGFLDRIVFNFLELLRTGKTHAQTVAASGHCNPPHPFGFRRLLEAAGLEILEYQTLRAVLSDIPADHPRYAWCQRLLERQEILRPAIFAVARKPSK